VRLLCESQADVLLTNKYGQTALHRAAALGHVSIIKALIEVSPARLRTNFVDAKDNEGNTALHMAVQDRHEECVAALLDAGALRDIKNDDGQAAMA
jgi:ankyrin repeat protein